MKVSEPVVGRVVTREGLPLPDEDVGTWLQWERGRLVCAEESTCKATYLCAGNRSSRRLTAVGLFTSSWLKGVEKSCGPLTATATQPLCLSSFPPPLSLSFALQHGQLPSGVGSPIGERFLLCQFQGNRSGCRKATRGTDGEMLACGEKTTHFPPKARPRAQWTGPVRA